MTQKAVFFIGFVLNAIKLMVLGLSFKYISLRAYIAARFAIIDKFFFGIVSWSVAFTIRVYRSANSFVLEIS